MSRFDGDDYDGPNFPNEQAFIDRNYDRALNSKKGRQSLAQLREALIALPDHKLIWGALCTVDTKERFDHDDEEVTPYVITEAGGEGVCAVGAYVWHQRVKAGADPAQAFESLPTMFHEDGDGPWETALEGQHAGLTYQMAWRLGQMNDEDFQSCTPEERWEKFVAWIDERLAIPYDPAKV
jgi:hypothetical protein